MSDPTPLALDERPDFDIRDLDEEDIHEAQDCPVCGAPWDPYLSCGCYEDLHYGND